MLKLNTELPLKLSALARLATRDMRKALDAGAIPDMGGWLIVNDNHCYVCMAGAVMLNGLPEPVSAFPNDFDDRIRQALRAIDVLRCGNVSEATHRLNWILGLDDTIDINRAKMHDCDLHYKDARTKDEALALCDEMDELAERLEADGL